jgi:hypothetical protein
MVRHHVHRVYMRSFYPWVLLCGWVVRTVGMTTVGNGTTGQGGLRVGLDSKDSPLRVHIVPHSHCDSGWLKTYTEYYWGDRQDIQIAGVQTILNSVVEALVVNPARRFVFAEMSFFAVWYRQQHEEKKAIVRRLVSGGQLGFVNGGWVQHDEAASHYVAMIDQTTRGHRFLKEEFGYVPRIGWQIDPFGHSSVQAGAMGAAMGFDAMFFGRADFEDMKARKELRQLEFLWRGTGAGPTTCDMDGMIFTGNFASGNYGPPDGFNFESSVSDTPVQDDTRLRGFNVDERVDLFVKRCHELAAVTRGDDIMFTMGSDFHYSSAEAWFTNLDKLIGAVNARFSRDSANGHHHRRIEVFYSTPDQYVVSKARQAEASSGRVSYPVKVDDFFPYADAPAAFWTGYFSSRAASKRYIRSATSFLQAARQLEAYYGGFQSRGDTVCIRGTDPLEEAVALTQHHDSITGTEKQAVADDYHVWLADGMEAAQEVVAKALASMLGVEDQEGNEAAGADGQDRFVFCPLLNESRCDFTTGRNAFTATVYNPTSFRRDIPISVPVGSGTWQVVGPDGQRLDADTVVSRDVDDVDAHSKVVFVASVEPLGLSSYLISTKSGEETTRTTKGSDAREISNGDVTLSFAPSGLADAITYADTNVTMPFSFSLHWYNSSDGLDSDVNRGQSSGAYIFRPNGRYPLLPDGSNVTLEIFHGDVISEARQTFNPWGSLVTRLYKDRPYLELEWTVGPLPLDEMGREVIIVYNVPHALSEMWTDANGRTMIRRLRSERFSWDSKHADEVAGNYYPITSAVVLQDAAKDAPGASLTVLTDRAQGAASLQEGQLEVMLHRRTIVDDGRGVEEPLDERGMVVRGRHHILLEHRKTVHSAAMRRQLQQELNDDAVLVFGPRGVWEGARKTARAQSLLTARASSALTFPLHLLTLKQESRTETQRVLTVRVAHQMDDINTLDGGLPRSIDAADLVELVQGVGCRNILSAREVSLSTNQPMDEPRAALDVPRFDVAGEIIGDVACEQVFFDHRRRPWAANEEKETDTGHGIVQPMSISTFEVVCAV